jgi:DNA recombination-dependent growth factor C
MNKFRRSGSFACLFVEGKMPSPHGETFTKALAEQRFRTIEDAASEDASVGWVTAEDPTGESFATEDLEHGEAVWLRMRADRKRLPSKWVAIYRAAAERSSGKKLSVREKRELKQDLLEKLLPRVLPSVTFVDALWLPEQACVLLFATGRAQLEAFDTLFCKTFDARLMMADPYVMALRSGIGDAQQRHLDQTSPVKWPAEKRPARRKPAETPVEAE